ncbi:methenyltetrahydromethanopterin cyclohydrolase [Methylococcus sp. EFPC2]|uniref:methenyltetrahydromethanopterin cyclohydrolase n=1 Tax=Methylococcus sp. EFPC2 TaxID=2812648 RepID=UPI0019679019|nr:methenyltetrahydromethanopterin cyclohydrolase [Methylococcus sp. EFPC2]QSA96733.1 methenyltetrahydromethanopterin cyclohydrolase [Methylococcus sp. EFPC2]
MPQAVSVNAHALPIVKHLIANADKLRLKIGTLANGATLIDAGIEALGSLEAGRLIGEICMGGLGTVTLTQNGAFSRWPTTVHVHSTNPVIACLGSQYAGWSLSHGEGKGAFYALGSGPARALAVKVKDGVEAPVEELYKELGYRDVCGETSIVLEVDKIPPVELVDKVAKACQLEPAKVNVIVTPTSSLAGGMQVVSRVLEVSLHKAHSLHFPLEHILDGTASAPVPPPHPSFVEAMGRTNDAILFGGTVHLFVKGSTEAAEKLANELPSSTSRDYGKPFAQVFKEYKYDFFKVDAMLFSPARVIVTAVESGRSFHAGQLDEELLERSFGGE